jgi:DNA (cytosine-5)-methyltransferase 1
MKIFSFFAGIGFLDLGFEMAGFEIAYVNEINPSFLGGHQYSRTQMKLSQPEYGYDLCDVASLLESERVAKFRALLIDAKKDGSLVGFIAGPPCPDFSVGGKNKGSGGENGKLTETYIELICRYQPDFFLFENVKGLWSTTKHRLFYDRMRSRLEHNGYVIADSLINTLQYGVPQSRQRAIAIGVKSDLVSTKSGHNLTDRFSWDRNKLFPLDCISSYPWPKTNPFSENSVLDFPLDIPVNLTVQYWFDKNDVKNHPNGKHYFQPRAGLSKFLSIPEGDDGKKSYKRLHRWRYSPTACYGNNEVHLHPYQARRISVAESLAIQSLPPEFELSPEMSLTNMFKSIGNGVPVLAAKGIASSIYQFLSDPHKLDFSSSKIDPPRERLHQGGLHHQLPLFDLVS